MYILDGLLICLSESDLMQAMLLNHDLARAHMLFVRSNLRESQIFVLQVRSLKTLRYSLLIKSYKSFHLVFMSYLQNIRLFYFHNINII